jgi:septal ring factor EnvC (AmiA/AmiB activator)
MNIWQWPWTRSFNQLNKRMDQIMATLQETTDALNALQATVDAERQQVATFEATLTTQIGALTTQVADLQAQIAAGGVVTAADLDAVVGQIAGISTSVQSIQP